MSIKSDWEKLLKSAKEEDNNIEELTELVLIIDKLKSSEDISEKDLELCDKKLNLVYPTLKELGKRECNKIEKLIKTQLLNLRIDLEKKKSNKITRWDIFKNEVYSNKEWKIIQEFIEYIECIENEEITEDDIKHMEVALKEIDEFVVENISNFEQEWVLRELKKKVKMFKNRVNRSVEYDFGGWIKQLRTLKGYSLMDLQKITGITASYIHRVETGSRKTPSLPVIYRLAKGLEVDPKEFYKKLNITGDDNKTNNKDFSELVTLNKFMIGGKKATHEIKSNVINIINKIQAVEWSSESKIRDGMEILELVDKLKKELE